MSWNYRVLKTNEGHLREPVFEVVEVYYDAVGHPDGYANAALIADSRESLLETISLMTLAFTKPVMVAGPEGPLRDEQ